MHTFQPIPVDMLDMNPFTKIGKEWALLTAGNKQESNTMTISWGGVGVLWGKNVVYVFVRDSRYTKELIDAGNQYDAVIAIGPMIMMKFVCETTRPYGIKTIVSMNTIMVDGTGMCGGCRLTVGGETKFACVDGPDFDGHLVDFDSAMRRGAMYKAQERAAVERREEHCNLFKKEVK